MSEVKLRLLHDILDKPFSLNKFNNFTREFFNGPNMMPITRDERIWLEYRPSILAYYKIATYKDGEGNNILVLAVELKKGSTVERARSLQRNFISKILDRSVYEAAIVAFYTPDELNWRLSLVRLDYSLTDKGIKLDLTPARRFSYLVGENEPKHTAVKQLFTIFENDYKNPTLDEIEEAFSVERVTNDFYNEYKRKYLDLKEHLEDNEEFINETKNLGLDLSKFAEQFSKKLMGQLSFLYFLQKKGWLGVRILPPNRELTKEEFGEIYNSVDSTKQKVLKKVFRSTEKETIVAAADILQSLDEHEAEILSDCFINSRYNMPWGSGDRNFIRGLFDFCDNNTELNFFNDYLEPFFYDALNKKRKNQYFTRFNCKIPFLNGGLFEPIEDYHWKDVNFRIPNHIFSNKKEKGREADGILDIFDMYNFTMNEDEPFEKEVAIDPEMLGKIFENLLDVSDRKSKGAFYTPREIVHYMCQESLINYLVNKVDVPYDDIKKFILYGEIIRDADNRKVVREKEEKLSLEDTIYNNIVEIDKALKNVKVADPAVGSGAFPLGMLSEIVKARNNITEYIIKANKEGKLDSFYTEKQIRDRRSEYEIKLKTIQNSIFAVDIEASAVDIAKLRLWLSLVVDQDIDESNAEPHPLPNLDLNIKVGNSLIDEFEGIKLFDETLLHRGTQGQQSMLNSSTQISMLLDHSHELLEDMFKLQDRYFSEENERKKREIKKKIDGIQDELIVYKLTREKNIEGLKRYEESLKNKTKPYFIWELEFAQIFKENEGFDIVIGNPPYIDSERMVKDGMAEQRTIIAKGYQLAKGNWDIYIPFMELGFNLLGNIGSLVYITPDKWISKPFGKEARKNLMPNIVSIFAAGRNVFESANVDSIVTLFSKTEVDKIKVFKYRQNNIDLFTIIPKHIFTEPYSLDLIFSDHVDIINDIDKNSKRLGSFYICENACATSDAYKLKDILYSLDIEKQYESNKHMKVINTGTIDKYLSRWGTKQMTYLKDKYLYPVVDKKVFSETFSNSYYLKSIKPKIIIKGLTLLDACLDEDGNIIPGKTTLMISNNDINELKFILALINSELFLFYLKERYSSSSYNGGINFTRDMINSLPIKNSIWDYKDILIILVDKILQIKLGNSDDDLCGLVDKINNIIYETYNISDAYIKIIKQA